MACVPTKSQTFDSTVLASETDYQYDFPLNDVTSVKSCLLQSGVCQASSPTTTYAYDSAGRVISKTDPCGNGSCADVIAGTGAAAASTSSNQCTNSASGTPGAYSTTYSYQCLASGGVNGAPAISYMYAIQPPPTGTGVHHGMVFNFDAAIGQLTSATDPNGNTSTYQYNDSLARLTATVGPIDTNNGNASATTTYSYTDTAPSPSVRTSQLLDTAGQMKTTASTEDGLGRQVLSAITSDPVAPDYVASTYDGIGNVLTSSNPYRSTSESTYGVVTFTYDALGRKIFELAQNGTSKKQWCYDGQPSMGQTNCRAHLGSVTTGTWVDYSDENGNSWQMTYNALGQLTEVMEPNGASTAPTMETDYVYDAALGTLLKVTQCGGSCPSSSAVKRTFFYNSLGQLVASNNPEAATALHPPALTCGQGAGSGWTNCFSYDLNGNLQSKTDNRTITTTYTYDALNRVLSKTYSDGITPPATFAYDTSAISGAANTIGHLTAETVTAGSTTLSARLAYKYDVAGNLLAEQQCTPANCVGPFYTPTYSYNLASGLVSASNGVAANPITLSYQYDTASRLSGITSSLAENANHPKGLFDATSISPAAYSAAGLVNASFGLNFTNGSATGTIARGYDNRLRILQETDQSNGAQTIAATPSVGTIPITGSEQVQLASSGTPGVGHVNISGGPARSGSPPQTGSISVTVNGHQTSASYNPGTTSSNLASTLASYISNLGAGVTATVSGSSITVTATTNGSSTNYPMSCSVSVSSGQSVFSVGCGSLTGGTNQIPTTTYDTGTVSVSVNGATSTYNYGSGSTSALIASGLASAINSNDGSFVTASAAGSVITITGYGNSANVNYPLSASVTFNSSVFSSPSYQAAAAGMSGGAPAQFNVATVYQYVIPSSGGYDPVGNLKSVTDSVMGQWSYSAYDTLNRLQSGHATTGTYANNYLCWAYDAWGNRTAQNLGTSACPATESSVSATASYNGYNQVTWTTVHAATSGFTYDAAGDVLNDGLNNYLYDAHGHERRFRCNGVELRRYGPHCRGAENHQRGDASSYLHVQRRRHYEHDARLRRYSVYLQLRRFRAADGPFGQLV